MKYDIFIPVHRKDQNKIKFLIDSIFEHLSGFDKIYLVYENKGKFDLEFWDSRLRIIPEEAVLPIAIKSKLKHRPNWLFQMFLKLFQDVTENDWYFTIDSDCIINRPFDIFTSDGKPIIYTPAFPELDQNHEPYFRFQELILGLPREIPKTFITDTNLMNKKIIREMLSRNNFTVESFIEKACEIITSNCYPGEPEIWGQYVMKYHRNEFALCAIKTRYNARLQLKPETQIWNNEDYLEEIEKMKKKDVDLFAIHSWYNEL